MKITDLTITLFAWTGIPPTSYARHTGRFAGESRLGLVAVATDQGVTGHAVIGAAAHGADQDAGTVVKYLKPLLIGEDPLDRARLYDRIGARRRYVPPRCLGAVDVALWDIAGKVAALPVHRLLGSFRHAVPAYASSAVLEAPAAYAEEAVRFKEAGWRAYKIHPFGRWREDIEICRAVRRAVGDDYTLMLDSTWNYRYEHALKVGRAIEELGFYWYEDPLADDDIYNCVKLKEKLDIPLMATEYAPGGFTAYAPWLLLRATDYLRGDVAVKGGITAMVKSAHLAEAFALNYEVHHGGNSHNNWANLHVIAAIPNTEFFEVLLPAAAQKYGVVDDLEVDRDGLVHVPDRPGIGAEIDFELIERTKLGVLA
ncbi:MAG TPA: enolase C-terminal domain-like protein [Alphaproteobacteria bacterium]